MLTPRSKRHGYHHGNLRESAIATGRDLIQQKGIQALGLRKIADLLNVSPAALYRHFDDLEHLQSEIAAEVRLELGESMLAERDRISKKANDVANAQSRFMAIGIAYLDFANAHPRLFESAFLFSSHQAEDSEDALAWTLLQESLQELREAGGLREMSDEDACILAWSTVHGFATLVAQNAIQQDDYEHMKISVLNGIRQALTENSGLNIM